MSDWADEIAGEFIYKDYLDSECCVMNAKDGIAAALRDAYERGKKDGAHPLELKLIAAGLLSRSGGGLW